MRRIDQLFGGARRHSTGPQCGSRLDRWRAWLRQGRHGLRLRLEQERDLLRDMWAQWFWFLLRIPTARVGFGRGPLTWRKRTQCARQHRDLHICLLAPQHRGLPFGPLTAWAINQNSRHCRATLNGGLDQADVIWVYLQDPIDPQLRQRLDELIRRRAKPGAVVVNAPAVYNAFHGLDVFTRLHAAGVRVPRSDFDASDLDQTLVVYKTLGQQGAYKVRERYSGPRQGMAPYEFIETSRPDGTYARYRAHYLFGKLRPSEVIVANHWNACLKHCVQLEYTFTLSADEAEQIRLIAQTLQLQYFAVDFLRRPDGLAVFTDINVYPTIQSPRHRVRARGDFGLWHTFEARGRLGLTAADEGDVWQLFDEALIELIAASASHPPGVTIMQPCGPVRRVGVAG